MSFDPDETLMAHAFGLPVDPGHSVPPDGETLTTAELDAVCAVVAVSAATPLRPSESSLTTIHGRLNLPVRRSWRSGIPWAGWGIAAGLAVLVTAQNAGWFGTGTRDRRQGPPLTTGSSAASRGTPVPVPAAGSDPAETATNSSPVETEGSGPAEDGAPENSTAPAAIAAVPDPATPGTGAGQETSPADSTPEEVLDEIRALRSRLAQAEQFSVARTEPVPGVSWPVVITMRPPGGGDGADLPPIISRITDAMSESGGNRPMTGTDALPGTAVTGSPSAYQIYDPARDTGTLTYRNLPPPPAGMEYTLWVTPAGSAMPSLVGPLPRGLAATDAVEFSLGAAGSVPEHISLWLSPEAPDLATATDQGTTAVPELPPADSILILQGP